MQVAVLEGAMVTVVKAIRGGTWCQIRIVNIACAHLGEYQAGLWGKSACSI